MRLEMMCVFSEYNLTYLIIIQFSSFQFINVLVKKREHNIKTNTRIKNLINLMLVITLCFAIFNTYLITVSTALSTLNP